MSCKKRKPKKKTYLVGYHITNPNNYNKNLK